jgi:hypothetical protein
MECWSSGVLEYWSIGVLEYWSGGKMPGWEFLRINLDLNLLLPHHSITPLLRSPIFDYGFQV